MRVADYIFGFKDLFRLLKKLDLRTGLGLAVIAFILFSAYLTSTIGIATLLFAVYIFIIIYWNISYHLSVLFGLGCLTLSILISFFSATSYIFSETSRLLMVWGATFLLIGVIQSMLYISRERETRYDHEK